MAGDYNRGEMDIHEQSATFEGFGKFTKWGSLAIATLLLTITVWFCTAAGPLAAFGAGIVLAVLGFLALREKPASTH